jgi:hypothetical protein
VAGVRVRAEGRLGGDLEVDLDVPAGDADLLDDEAQQTLAAVEVEFLQRGERRGAAGELVEVEQGRLVGV